VNFFQDAPQLANQYEDDRVLRRYLRRVVPREVLAEIEPALFRMGGLAAGRLFDLAREYRGVEPEHIPYDEWGRRIDEVRVSAAWQHYARVAAEEGLVAVAYERSHGAWSRLHQFALAYLFHPSTQVYSCPLAMTDGSARTLEVLASPGLRERALPRLISRDPERHWTAGQWMTERIGGSDVGLSEATARQSAEGWRLDGVKWFTSSVTAPMALTLARPEGNGAGGKGLALFYLELRDAEGRLNGITLNRLKDKLGTRFVPTAELTLAGTLAQPVAQLSDGVRNMAWMLNLTRTWNAVCSAAALRRGIALARDYARRRVAFGARLAEKPLHTETLANLVAEQEGAFQLTFHAVKLLGLEETGELDEAGRALLRLLQPVAKLVTAKQAVAGVSEVLEAFGGAGYVEDTGLPELLRDAQVFPIWEGATNVLALEAFRAIQRSDALGPFVAELRARAGAASDARLREPARAALAAAEHVERWWDEAKDRDPDASEASARRFALTLGRAMSLALLAEQAQWDLEHEGDARSAEAARRYAHAGVDLLGAGAVDPTAAACLAMDETLPAREAEDA
jgi:alkylation response protein AidB-like acyl-CoA dehydrogenase